MQGEFLSTKDSEQEHEVVLSCKLAKSLNAQMGSEIIAIVQVADGSLGNDLYKVKGILKSISSDIERGTMIMS